MKGLLLFILGLLTTLGVTAQSVNIIEGDTVRMRKRVSGSTVLDVLGQIKSTKTITPGSDTTSSKNGLAIVGGKLKVGNGTIFNDVTVATPKDTFAANFKINGVDKYLKWVNGDSVPAKGLTAKELFLLGSSNSIHPAYTQPTISLTNSSVNVEYGYYFGTFNYNYTYYHNDAGSTTGVTYYVNNVAQSNPYTVGNVTANFQFKVSRSYNQEDTCLRDNLGAVDCYGRVTAGTVTSNIVQISPYHKRYLGFSSTLQGDGTPSDANVLSAYYIDTNGGSSSINNTAAQQSSAKYLFFVTTSPVTSVSINGFPSTDGFNLNLTRTFVNAVGGSYTYYFTVSKSPSYNASTTAISIN